MLNLFDFTTGCNSLTEKPRRATMEERNAYLRWLADRDGIAVPANATFGDDGISASGELILAMPGYGDTRRATLEVLDDDGNVIRSTPIAVDARGRMTMTKAQVQEATGLKPARKAAKPKTKRRAPIVEIEPAEIASRSAPQSESVAAAMAASREAADALPEASPADPIADRVAALELQLAGLVRAVGAIGGMRTRSAAHERAVRRAWAERKAARLQRSIAEDHMRMREKVADAMKSEVRHLKAQLESKHTNMEKWASEARKGRRSTSRRMAAAQRSRRMIGTLRTAEAFQRGRADTLAAQLAKAKDDLDQARLSPTYMDASGREAPDHISRAVHHAGIATERAERAQGELGEARAAMQRMDIAIDRLGEELMRETKRRIQAEAALAALQSPQPLRAVA